MSDLINKETKKDETAADHGKCMLNRSQFLMYSGSAAIVFGDNQSLWRFLQAGQEGGDLIALEA